MRNRMISVILLIFVILLSAIMFHGIKIGNIEILSIAQLKEKNNLLDKRIEAASELTSIEYPKNVETLEKSFEEYSIEKNKYQELTGESIDNIEEMYETKQYDISYLWRVLGKYAEKRKLTLGIDIKSENTSNNTYNLNFTISGEYTNIILFITDIENNSDLYFRIYNFKMTGSETVTATFTVKNVNIDPSTIKNTQSASINSLNKSK